MAARDLDTQPLVVIVGPTASGKTSLAIELAQKFNGEIICADSRTIYKGMDIGTAKPTKDDQAKVSHWGIDLVEPGEYFSVADFKRYADQKILEIRARGRTPFLVGGTGLYIDAVIFNYTFGAKADDGLRKILSELSVEQLQKYCYSNNVMLPKNPKNKRHIIRAIENKSSTTARNTKPISTSIIVGISTKKDELIRRMSRRAAQLVNNNVVEETTVLSKKYGWGSEAMTGNVYPLVRQYLSHELTMERLKEKITTRDWQLAKRQLTWFRRNPYIKWFSLADAKEYLNHALANE